MTNNILKNSHKLISWKKLCKPEENGKIYLKWWKGRTISNTLPKRISFRFEGEIKSFTDKQKCTEFSTTKPAVQQMLKELL